MDDADGTPQQSADWPWLLAICAATAVYFWPVLFGGQSFFYRDTAQIYHPQALLTARSWLSGTLPLWEPTIGLGYPFQADPHSMVFYPLTVLLLLPFPWGYNLFVVVHVALGGIFTYLLLRRWELSPPAAAMGAAVTLFCGYTASCTSLTTLLRGSVWAMAALWLFDLYLQDGRWRHLLLTALSLAVQGSGTDPQYTLFTWVLLVVYGRVRREHAARWAAGVIAVPVVVFALLAYQYAPLAELIGQSDRSAGLAKSHIGGFAVKPLQTLNMLIPTPFGAGSGPYFLTSLAAGRKLYNDLFVSVPVLALAFAAIGWSGLLAIPSRVMLATAGLSLLLCYGYATPLFPLLMLLVPPARAFRFAEKYMLITSVAVAAACALGFEGLRRGEPGCVRAFRRSLEAMGAVLLVLLAALALIGPELLTGLLEISLPGERYAPREFVLQIARGWMVSIGAMLAAATLCRALSARERPSRAALACIGSAAVLAMAAGTWRALPTTPDAFLTTPPEALPLLGKPEPGAPPPRFVGVPDHSRTPSDLPPTLEAFAGWSKHALVGLHCITHRVQNVDTGMSVHLKAIRDTFEQLAQPGLQPMRRRVAAALGATRAIEVEEPGDNPPGMPIVGRVGGGIVRAMPGATPRAFVAGRATPSSEEVVPTRELLFALPRDAVFEAPPGTAPLVPESSSPCRFTAYEAHRLEVEFDLRGDGLLVVMDQHYPGWRAFVDGQERPILRVDGIARGVRVSGGQRRLEMRYEPASFRIGALVSAISCLLFAAALALASGTVDGALARPVRLAFGLYESQRTWWSRWGFWTWPLASTLVLGWFGLLGPAVFFFRDTLSHYLPEAWLSAKSWSLWMPGAGPSLEYGRWLGLYPLSLFLSAPFPKAYTVFTLAHLPLAGLATAALLLRWGHGRAAASLGGAVAMLCGLSTGSTALPACLRALTWTPVVMLALDCHAGTGRKRWLAAAAAALVAEAMGTEPAFLAGTCAIVLALPWLRPSGGGLGSSLLCLAIAAPFVAARLLRVSWWPVGIADASPMVMPWLAAVSTILPWPVVDPGSTYFITNFPRCQLPLHLDVYWGLPVLALAAGALGWLAAARIPEPQSPDSPPASPILELGPTAPDPSPARAGWLAAARIPEPQSPDSPPASPILELGPTAPDPSPARAGWPAVRWRRHVLAAAILALAGALCAVTYSARGLLVAAPAVAILAAAGLEGLRVSHPRCLALFGAVVSVGSAGLLAALAALATTGPALPLAWIGGAFSTSDSEVLGVLVDYWRASLSLAVQIPLLLTALALARWRDRVSARTFALAVALLAAADLALVADRHLLLGADPRVAGPDRTAHLIRAGHQTVAPLRYISYPPNELVTGQEMTLLDVVRLGIDLQSGLHGVPKGLEQVVDLSSPRGPQEARLAEIFLQAGSREARDRLAASLGAVAALSPEGLGNAPGAGRELGRAGPVVVRALEAPSPRVFIAPRAEPAAPGAQLPSLQALSALPRSAVYEGGSETFVPAAVRACGITSYQSDSVEMEIDLDGRGLLVLLDPHGDGWSATVDGRPRKIVKVAGRFRGVAVSAGERRVRMRYRPWN